MVAYLDSEFAYLSLYGHQFCLGDNLDVGRPTGLNQFRCKNSDSAVVSGKGLVKLRHDSPDGSFLLHQINTEAQMSQIKGGLYTGNAATDDHHRANNVMGVIDVIHMTTLRDGQVIELGKRRIEFPMFKFQKLIFNQLQGT